MNFVEKVVQARRKGRKRATPRDDIEAHESGRRIAPLKAPCKGQAEEVPGEEKTLEAEALSNVLRCACESLTERGQVCLDLVVLIMLQLFHKLRDSIRDDALKQRMSTDITK